MTDITTSAASSNGTGGASTNGADSSVNDTEIKNPESILAKNRELLALQRKQKDELDSMKNRLAEIEQQKMSAEGKKDEVITKLNEQIRSANTELSKLKTSYAVRTVQNQVKQKAAEMGCVDTDLLLKAVDLQAISVVDEEFNVDQQLLGTQMESLKKTKPFLFKKSGPDIKDGIPVNSGMQNGVDVSKMSLKEMKAFALKNNIT